MINNLYPLKFKTIFKDKIWGGEKIKTYLGKDFSPLPNCGETWEISGVKSDVSIIANGPLKGTSLASLLAQEKENLVGKSVYQRFGDEFPLLVKFIDANEDLSIQVHPDDALAKKRHNSFGKTEMWYVIQADKGASLITGFNQKVDKALYLKKFNAGQLIDILNREQVKADDVFFLPAGRVHTIGKGLLVAEIQQTSDITYRIYDFDRIDAEGHPRELHTEQALNAIDFNFQKEYKTNYEQIENEVVNLIECPYFTTNVLEFSDNTNRDYTLLDSFVIHVCLEGSYTINFGLEDLPVNMGDCVLIPATINKIVINTNHGFKILESYIS